jgi:hypothetical protein
MLLLDLAGWRFGVRCQPAALEAAAAARFAPFLAAGAAEADVRLAVALDRAADVGRPAELLAAPLMASDAGYRLAATGMWASISLANWQCELVLGSTAPLEALEYGLRVVAALFAYCHGGLLVHAAAVLVNGDAQLFIGQSGSGKSTVAALSAGRPVLGDDLILLRPAAGGWTAYGTPFWNPDTGGRASQTASGPVIGISKLTQDRDVFVTPLPRPVASAELMANCPVVNSRPEWVAGLLARCRQLAADVPVQQLHFRKDDAFWLVLPGPALADDDQPTAAKAHVA